MTVMNLPIDRRLVVAVDIDGVLGETQEHLLSRANAEYGIHMTRDDLSVWDPKIGPSTFEQLIERYLLDPDWIMGIHPVAGSVEGMAAIRREADVIIASTTIKETEHIRALWVEKNYGFKPVFINTWGRGKAGVPADILIDDYDSNLRAFTDALPGRAGILITQPWNINAQPNARTRRTSNWEEIVAVFATMNTLRTVDSSNPTPTQNT